jgi:uncharacterized membrane protein YvbJ
MTQIKPRKESIDLSIEQKLDDAKLMVHENDTNKKVMSISGLAPQQLVPKQYLAELNGETPELGKALTSEQQEIQSLKKHTGVRKGTMKS